MILPFGVIGEWRRNRRRKNSSQETVRKPAPESPVSSGIASATGWCTSGTKASGSLFALAVERGLISREGYLTPEGHSFLATHGSD